MFDVWISKIEKNLDQSLKLLSPEHDFSKVIRYSLLPAGKYFRPLLCLSLAKDLGATSNDHMIIAQALEIHHTYTLIHDDLPAMDNDDMRRGRPSSHIQYNEWRAILAGDSLLNMSYALLASMESNKVKDILALFGEYLGPKGLILGQVMDLGGEYKTIDQILKLHELKTGRLIQLALESSNLIAEKPIDQKVCHELGRVIGINFQLLDDLCELTQEVNDHENEVNPFLNLNSEELISIIHKNHYYITSTLQEYKLTTLSSYLNVYYAKVELILKNGKSEINKHIKFDLKQIF